MLRPVLMIGCGGSGEKAVRYVRDAVMRRLEHSGWDQGMPDPWQFIGLDTLVVQEAPTEIPTIPESDFLTLSPDHNSYGALHRALLAVHDETRGRPDLLWGWLPGPEGVRIPLRDGAGQNRSIGRAAGLVSLDRVLLPRLKEAFERAKSGAQVLYEVGQYLGVDAELGSRAPDPLVVICSSMAGGTGAGVVLDVVDLVRKSDPLGAHPSLVLFSNDIFEHLGRQSMAANSLGLVSELLAAYWSEAGDIESPVSYDGVQQPGVGPHSIFMLGKYGLRGADLGDTSEVYRATGEALSTWVTSDVVQERIHNFINVNWRNDANSNYGGYPFGEDQQFGAMSSFGAAKVTVGRDRFAQWAEDKLAREVLGSLLTGHLRTSLGGPSGSHLSDTERVQKLAESYVKKVCRAQSFTAQPGTTEIGCWSAPDEFASNQKVLEVAAQVRQAMAYSPTEEGSGAQWLQFVERDGHRQMEEIEQMAQATNDGAWCQEMVDRTCRAVSEVVGAASLSVAAAALLEAADRQNPVQVEKARKLASEAEGKCHSHIGQAREKLKQAKHSMNGDDPTLAEAVELVARGIAFRWQGLRLAEAANVMEQVGEQVFRPMASALKSAQAEVGHVLEDDVVKAWPTEGSGVSERYLPSSVELPLETHEMWEQMLQELCAEAAQDNVPYGSRGTDPLRYRLIAGDADIASFVHRPPLLRWHPGQPVSLECRAGAEAIQARVQEWTRAPEGRFHRVVGEGLASYLAEEDPVTGRRRENHATRMQEFRQRLGEAMTRAEPLVRIDDDLYATHHHEPQNLLTVCSQFPFGAGHSAGDEARKIVGDAAYQVTSQDTASVLVSRYIQHPLHPLAVRSFTDPIMEALNDNQDPGQRARSFWLWRRARPLDAFVPMPRRMVESLISGFPVARLCGYVTAKLDGPVCITAGPGEVEFPWPLLSRLKTADDLLAGLLESFPLTFGMVGGGGTAVYEPFKRLYELGEPVVGERLPDDLRRLLEEGQPPHGTVDEPRASGSTPEERLKNAVDYLNKNLTWFIDLDNRRSRSEATQGMDGMADEGVPTMELARLYIPCYEKLLLLLSQVANGGPEGRI